MKILSLPEPSLFELEEIVESGMSFAHANQPADSENLDSPMEVKLYVQYLIAGSERFRQNILKIRTDPIYCALLKTRLMDYLPKRLVKLLAQSAREVDVSRIGKTVFVSDAGEKTWFVLVSGKLKATLLQPEGEEEEWCEITVGEVFGGYTIGDDADHIRVEVLESSKYIELNWDELERIDNENEHSATKLLSVLGVNSWQHLSFKGGNRLSLTDSETIDPKSLKEMMEQGSKTSLVNSFRKMSTGTGGSSRGLSSNAVQKESDTPQGNQQDAAAVRRFSLAPKRLSATASLSSEPMQEPFSEPELDEIKSAFNTIHSLWQDISMGADTVSMSLLSAVHDHLGEIGSELFSQIFLSGSNKKEVCCSFVKT